MYCQVFPPFGDLLKRLFFRREKPISACFYVFILLSAPDGHFINSILSKWWKPHSADMEKESEPVGSAGR